MRATHLPLLLGGLGLALGAAAVVAARRRNTSIVLYGGSFQLKPVDRSVLDERLAAHIEAAVGAGETRQERLDARMSQVEAALVRRATPFAMAARGPSFRRG